jgi:dipeptidyl aminopeptidase/acylaminoacyl peptidase
MAQPFDAGRRATRGDAVPVAEKVARVYATNAALGSFSVSANGVLAYAGGDWAGVSMTWLDRAGQRLSPPLGPGFVLSFNLSPDRRRGAAAMLTGGNADIWIYDLSRTGLRSRFTFSPASERNAIWSPDGSTIVFDSNGNGRYDLFRKHADGSGAEELLFADQENKTPTSWSPDGKALLYETGTSQSTIWVFPLKPEQPGGPLKPHPWLQTGFFAQKGPFSPDGKWVMYQSNESGRVEIYVALFPGPGGKRRVSTAGGAWPRWRSDGKEIFYVSPDDMLTAVDVTIRGTAIEFGQPHSLFGLVSQGASVLYDTSADGRRILTATPIVETGDAGETINLVQDWVAGLKR